MQRGMLLPLEIKLAVGDRAIAQVQVNQALVGDAHVSRNGLEVIDALFIQADRDLLLELGSVGVFDCLGKVVFGAHGFHLS